MQLVIAPRDQEDVVRVDGCAACVSGEGLEILADVLCGQKDAQLAS